MARIFFYVRTREGRKEESSFSEEKEAKRLYSLAPWEVVGRGGIALDCFASPAMTKRAKREKVFWFFFSKKNLLKPFPEPFDGRDQGPPYPRLQRRVPGIGDDGEACAGPGAGEVEGADGGADHVVAALDDVGRNVGDAVHVRQQPAFRQEELVHEVVRLDAGEAEGGAVLREAGDGVGAGQEGGAGAFVDRPGAGGGEVDGGVGVGEAAEVAGRRAPPPAGGRRRRRGLRGRRRRGRA